MCPVSIHHFWKFVFWGFEFDSLSTNWPLTYFLFLVNVLPDNLIVFSNQFLLNVSNFLVDPHNFNKFTYGRIHLHPEQSYYEVIFAKLHLWWHFVYDHRTLKVMSLNINSLELIKVICIVENQADRDFIFKSYENYNILLFNKMDSWSPVFYNDTFSIHKLRSFFPYVEVCFSECEWLSETLPIFLFFIWS